MAQEMRDQSRVSEEQQSPYVAQAENLGQAESQERGLHLGGKNTGPLETTHDTNIGHGHEPFSTATTESGYVAPAGAGDPEQQHHQKRGMGEKMKDAMRGVKEVVVGHKDKTSPRSGEKISEQQQQQRSGEKISEQQQRSGERIPEQQQQQQQHPGFVDKVKDAVTGQKPGHGAATGYATAGSAVPGEEDYAGKFDRRGSPEEAGVEQHDSNWPHPVPPPGISDTSVPQEHHRPDVGAEGKPYPGGEEYAGEKPSAAAGTYSSSQNIDERVPGQQAAYNPEQGQNTVDTGSYEQEPQRDDDIFLYRKEEDRNLVDTGMSSVRDEDRRPVPVDTGMSGAKDEVHDPIMISTPAEPDARHDTPSVENQSGGEYTDPHGKVHGEGPRDDNVKKEGLMSKMMDKLHIGSKPRAHKDGSKETSPTTGA